MLTYREMQIAVLIAAGETDKGIANRLGISAHTVRTYLRRMFLKLGVHNRAAMIAKLSMASGGRFVQAVKAF